MRRCVSCFEEIGDFAKICPYCGYMEGSEIQTGISLPLGSRLADRYTLGKILSSDQNTVTYAAWDEISKIRVRIIEYLPSEYVTRDQETQEVLAYNEDACASFDKGFLQFVDEAKRLFNEGGDGTLYDCIAENNTAYMIMEYSYEQNPFTNASQPEQPQEQVQDEQPQEQPAAPQEQSPFAPEPAQSAFAQTPAQNAFAPAPEQNAFAQTPSQIPQPEAVSQPSDNNNGLMQKLSLLPLWLKITVPAVLVFGIVVIIIIAGAAKKPKEPKDPKNTGSETAESSEETEATIDVTQLGVELVTFRGHTYACFNNAASWEDAEKYCESLGGHLVTITTKEENDAVWAYVKDKGNQSVFIGLSDTEEEGKWQWVTGEQVTYTKWTKGEPNAYTESENYAEYAFNVDNGEWNDFRFDVHNSDDVTSYICEWDYDVINSADTQLSADQATLAFKYYIAQMIDDDRVSYNELISWDYLKKENTTYFFYCRTYTGECIRYFMDQDTGITTSLKYTSDSCDMVVSLGEFDFNARDYLKDSSTPSDDAATELKSFMNTDIKAAAEKLGGLEDLDSEDATEYQGDDIFLSTTRDNDTDNIKYIQIRGNSVKYSLYGISLGMSRKAAFTKLVLEGAKEVVRNDPNTFSFTFSDGTTVSVTCNESKTVTYIAAMQ